MQQKLDIEFLEEAISFIAQMQDRAAQRKLNYVIGKTLAGYYGDWFKKLKGSEGIWEFRVKADNKFIRLFAFWDKTGETDTLIVATHGIYKKTRKTPIKEIAKAEAIRQAYFDELERKEDE